MIHARTKAGIEKAKLDGVKFGRGLGRRGSNSDYKAERIRIFLMAGKSYQWICQELSVSRHTVSAIKKAI